MARHMAWRLHPTCSVRYGSTRKEVKTRTVGDVAESVSPPAAFEEICMLDQLSGGRLDLGIGRGGVPLELSFFGVSAADAQDRYNEAAEIVIKAKETDALAYYGRHFSISDAPITLSPIRKPYPPL